MAISAHVEVAEVLLSSAVEKGVSRRALLHEAGLTEAQLEPDRRISAAATDRLLNAAAALTGDPAFGLLAGKVYRRGPRQLLGYAVRASDTLRAGLERFQRSVEWVFGAARLQFTPTPTGMRLAVHWQHQPATLTAARADFAASSVVSFCRHATGTELNPTLVTFRHAAPVDLAAHRALFRCPIEFSRPLDTVHFDTRSLELPMVHADARLARLLEKELAAKLSSLPGEDTVAMQVRGLLANSLRDGVPSAGELGAQLGLSPRTLQRRLKAEGASLAGLLDEVRRELALAYLGPGRRTPSEVAWLLGFSEPSAFHRAFKRWTGRTPSSWQHSRSGKHLAVVRSA